MREQSLLFASKLTRNACQFQPAYLIAYQKTVRVFLMTCRFGKVDAIYPHQGNAVPKAFLRECLARKRASLCLCCLVAKLLFSCQYMSKRYPMFIVDDVKADGY